MPLPVNLTFFGGGGGGGGFPNTQGGSKPRYPGNDPTKPPGEGFEWRGNSPPGSGKGNWYNPNLSHQPPIGPHWDFKNSNGELFRVFPDGRVEPK